MNEKGKVEHDEEIRARLVYDYNELGAVYVPASLGLPRSDQMQGTPLERLVELSGRICYDSMGEPKSRGSVGYHKHIQEVRHHSVIKHAVIAIRVLDHASQVLIACANRQGVTTTIMNDEEVRITANLQAILEWDDWTEALDPLQDELYREPCTEVGNYLKFHAYHAAPQILGQKWNPLGNLSPYWRERVTKQSRLFKPTTESGNESYGHELWLSLYLSGSRGLSHEQVRHGAWSAISQRSTRFCAEDGSHYVIHPLLSEWEADTGESIYKLVGKLPDGCIEKDREAYRNFVSLLTPWLTARGVDPLTARKQARGAARGFLGNALSTEMIFSATITQWRWMLQQRGSAAADAEIRVLFSRVLPEVQKSRYADWFRDMSLAPSPDGIGQIVKLDDVQPSRYLVRR